MKPALDEEVQAVINSRRQSIQLTVWIQEANLMIDSDEVGLVFQHALSADVANK